MKRFGYAFSTEAQRWLPLFMLLEIQRNKV
jgi:hypothetical protein